MKYDDLKIGMLVEMQCPDGTWSEGRVEEMHTTRQVVLQNTPSAVKHTATVEQTKEPHWRMPVDPDHMSKIRWLYKFHENDDVCDEYHGRGRVLRIDGWFKPADHKVIYLVRFLSGSTIWCTEQSLKACEAVCQKAEIEDLKAQLARVTKDRDDLRVRVENYKNVNNQMRRILAS